MTYLESVLNTVEFTDAFRTGLDSMRISFHAYYDDEGILYEEEVMDEAVEESGAKTWANGVTKVALIFDNYVLKTSFSGYAHTENEEGEPLDETEFDDNFSCDYCEIEYKVYRKAVDRHVNKFFAETISLGDGVYMQERYDSNFEGEIPNDLLLPTWIQSYIDSGHGYEWAEFHSETMNLGGLFEAISSNAILFAWLVAMYDYNDLVALSKFLEEFEINDLHSGNVGWFGDKLKFIDYSGYLSNTPSIVKD